MTREYNEALCIEIDDEETSTTSMPTADTDGVALPKQMHFKEWALDIIKTVAGGTPTWEVEIWGHRKRRYQQSSDENTEVSSSGSWHFCGTTGAESATGTSYGKSYPLEDMSGFDRVATVINTNGGTTPKLTTMISACAPGR